MRKHGNYLTRYSNELRYSRKQAEFRTSRNHFRDPEIMDPALNFNNPHLMPDLMQRLEAIENYESQLFLIKRSFRDSAFQLRFYQSYTDINNYIFYRTVVWDSKIFLYQKITVVAGNATYRYTSNYPIQRYIENYIDEPIEANYTVGSSPYPAQVIGLDNILVIYPGYEFYPKDMPSTLDDFWTMLAELKDLYIPVKSEFAGVSTLVESLATFGDLTASQEYWKSGRFDTAYVFNVGHYIPEMTVIDRSLTSRVVDYCGPGLIVLRILDEAIDDVNQDLLEYTCMNNVIIIPDILGFDRTDYLPINLELMPDKKTIIDIVKKNTSTKDKVWVYSVASQQFISTVQPGRGDIWKYSDVREIANNINLIYPRFVYSLSALEAVIFTFWAISTFNHFLQFSVNNIENSIRLSTPNNPTVSGVTPIRSWVNPTLDVSGKFEWRSGQWYPRS